MGRERNPDFVQEEEAPGRLERDTEERQSVEELVPDGMEDEANVEAGGDESAEEEAVRSEELR